jgi:hypothetical protein
MEFRPMGVMLMGFLAFPGNTLLRKKRKWIEGALPVSAD